MEDVEGVGEKKEEKEDVRMIVRKKKQDNCRSKLIQTLRIVMTTLILSAAILNSLKFNSILISFNNNF